MKDRPSYSESVQRLTSLFQRNGYTRFPNQARRQELRTRYKKGWEVRLPAKSRSELAEIRGDLKNVGLRPGRPYKNALRWVQPVYGKTAVETFIGWTGNVSLKRRRPGRKL